jgi:hypothetical protein
VASGRLDTRVATSVSALIVKALRMISAIELGKLYFIEVIVLSVLELWKTERDIDPILPP